MIKNLIIFLLTVTLLVSISLPLMAQNQEVGGTGKEENLNSSINTSDLFIEALNDYNQKNYSLAEEKFATLLEKKDLTEELQFSVLYYLTMTSVNKNQSTKAINYLENLNRLGFRSGHLNWRIAQLFLNKNKQFDNADFKKALKYLKKAENLGLKNLEFKRDYAYAYFENDELENAEKLYQEIINAKAEAEDYLYLAQIKKEQNKLNKAVEYYESALKLNSNRSSLYLNLANLYQELNQDKKAVSIYKQGIKLKNNFAPYYIGLGESYLKLENYDQAELSLKKAVEINKNSYYGYYLLGNIKRTQGLDDQALNYYAQAIKNNTNYVEAFLAEGIIHLNRGAAYRAISRFSLAVEKNPDYSKSHYYLGKAYYEAEMLEAARSELRKTLHIDDSYQQARELLDKIEAELDIN